VTAGGLGCAGIGVLGGHREAAAVQHSERRVIDARRVQRGLQHLVLLGDVGHRLGERGVLEPEQERHLPVLPGLQ
jgi:hypothetical protein